MNTKSALFTNLIILAVGILLIIYHNSNVISTIIVITGVAFIVASLFNLVMLIKRNRSTNTSPATQHVNISIAYGIIASLGGIGLGAWMAISPASLVSIVVYLFAALLVIAGLYNIIMLFLKHKLMPIPLWLYILPALMAIAGIVILCTDIKTIESTAVLITGIATTAFAINRFIEISKTDDAHTQQ